MMTTMKVQSPPDLTAKIRSLRNDCEALSRQADISAQDKRKAVESAQAAGQRVNEEKMAGLNRELELANSLARQLRAALTALP